MQNPTTPAPTLTSLIGQSQQQLDDLFKQSPAGPIPSGSATGEAIVYPGTFWAKIIARFVHDLAWKGKNFTANPDGDGATLENRIGVTGTPLIVARVYYTESWLDGKQCIVLDYSKTSLLAKKIRDEIRLVDPVNKVYLGKVWWGTTRLVDFALDFP